MHGEEKLGQAHVRDGRRRARRLTAFAKQVLGGCVAEGPSTVEPASPEPAPEPLSYDSVFPPHAPLGRGVGAMPGRVAWVRDAAAVSWDGSGYWWERGHFDEAVIRRMVSDGVAATAGAGGAAAGWRALFEAHNARAGREGGYRAGQKIAVKANMNGAGTFGSDEDSSMSYTTPVLLRALLLSLVEDGGVAPGDITVYDVCRIVPGHVRELCSEGALSGVCFRYNDEGGGNDVVGDEAATTTKAAETTSSATRPRPSCGRPRWPAMPTSCPRACPRPTTSSASPTSRGTATGSRSARRTTSARS